MYKARGLVCPRYQGNTGHGHQETPCRDTSADTLQRDHGETLCKGLFTILLCNPTLLQTKKSEIRSKQNGRGTQARMQPSARPSGKDENHERKRLHLGSVGHQLRTQAQTSRQSLGIHPSTGRSPTALEMSVPAQGHWHCPTNKQHPAHSTGLGAPHWQTRLRPGGGTSTEGAPPARSLPPPPAPQPALQAICGEDRGLLPIYLDSCPHQAQ